MVHSLRNGALPVDVSDKDRELTAPWIIDYTGEPRPFEVPAGTGVYYDLANGMVHIRDPEQGMSRSYAPEIDVYINHADRLFDVSFRDRERPYVSLPSVQIQHGRLQFIHSDHHMMVNSDAFSVVCRYLNDPIYNPFETAIPSTKKGEFVFSISQSEICRRDGTPVDEMFSSLKSFNFQTSIPLTGSTDLKRRPNANFHRAFTAPR